MLDLKVSYPSLKCAQLKEITIKHSLFHSTAVVRMQPMKMYFLLSSLPMVNYSSCVWVGMVLIEDGRRKSVSFQWDSMLFLWFFEQQEGTSKYHLLVTALLLRSPGVTEEVNLWEQSQVTCTDGVSLIQGCKWTRVGKFIQSKQCFRLRHLFNGVAIQLGLGTWIWGV